jgi:hypothetical protein
MPQIPFDLADLFPPLPCGRFGWICGRLFCRERCARTDVHTEHRCAAHPPVPVPVEAAQAAEQLAKQAAEQLAEQPTAKEWAAAAWAIQAWIRSCFEVTGRCALCGTDSPRQHVNRCPWPQTRALLDRSPPPD